MPTNDDELITDPEHVTGEYAAITAQANREWEIHRDTCQFFCQQGNICAEGARLLAKTTGGQGQ